MRHDLPGRPLHLWLKRKVVEAKESVLLLKTTDLAQRALTTRLMKLHPYEAPEILVWSVRSDDPDYSDWLAG